LPYLKLVGAALLLWIGVKLLSPEGEEGHEVKAGSSFLAAIKTIIVADAVMSLDNVLAVAGAAGGNLALVSLGVLISIPIIVWGSQLVLKLMDRFPQVVLLGGGLLGWIAGSMAVSDIAVVSWMPNEIWSKYLAASCGAALVMGVGLLLRATASTVVEQPND
jgi:YjbE family integral membrane protein